VITLAGYEAVYEKEMEEEGEIYLMREQGREEVVAELDE